MAGRYTRRQLLATTAVTAGAGTAGCMNLWSGTEETVPDQVSLTIKTVPADDDYLAASIMGQLRENLNAAGIETTHEPVSEREFYRDILLERDYDIFVGSRPVFRDPDSLRGFLHSEFANENGWQNPFTFSNVSVNEYLETQHREESDARQETLGSLFELLERTVPYSVVVFPDHLGGRRSQYTTSWSPNNAEGYFEFLSNERPPGGNSEPFRVGLFGQGIGDRFNPIAVDATTAQPLLELLYDPLVRRIDGEYYPWLAEDVSWDESRAGTTASVTLRPELTWHDGEPIDPSDVVFTYDFLDDTSFGAIEAGVPTAQYRGLQTVVETVSVTSTGRIEFEFETPSRSVAERALRIPLLPEHVWDPRSEPIGDYRTEAKEIDNEEPVGSGLFQFGEREGDELLVFEPFRDHVLRDMAASNRPSVLDGFTPFDGIEFQIVGPYPGVLVDMLSEGEIDAIGSNLPPEDATSLFGVADATMVSSPSQSMYLIGYNFSNPQLGDPQFRRIVSRLVDREHVVEEICHGYGEKPDSLAELVGVRSTEDELEQTPRSNILEFPGTDGEIDQSRVHSLFEEYGYRYVDGNLLE